MKSCLCALLVLALAAVVGFGSGCGSGERPAAVKTPTEAVTAVDMSELPEFLHYPGVTATEKMAVSTSDSKGTVWTLVSGDPRAAVAEWYRTSLAGKGWESSPETEAGESTLLSWAGKDGKEMATLLLTDKDGKTNVSLTHAFK